VTDLLKSQFFDAVVLTMSAVNEYHN